MNTFEFLSGVMGILIYVPLCIQILRKKATQKISSYTMWLLLDGITAITIWVDGGNFILPAAYATGCVTVCLCIWKSEQFSWTWFETIIAGMVVLCMIVWWLTEAAWATVIGTFAGVIAGIPMTRHAYQEPHKQPMFTFWTYLVSNLLGILAGNEWSIQERFYPTVCFIFTSINVIVTLWRRSVVKKDVPAIA